MEANFKVGSAASVNISRAPFNVKLPVRRGTRGRGENATATGKIRAIRRCLIGEQIVLIREDSLAHIDIGQGTGCAKITGIAGKLQIAIGTDERTVKARPIKEDRERKCNRGGAIIAVVACVRGPRNDHARPSRCAIVAAWRRRRCRGRGRRRRCWRRR